jgi:hypothetical protein
MARKQKREESLTKNTQRTKRQTKPETKTVETSAPEENAETMETQVNANETVELNVPAVETPTETPTDAASQGADIAAPPTGDASEVAQPETDSATALALKRWRERPTCCCDCGKVLSSAKKHFIQGHDGKAKAMVRKIMRGELQPQDAPPELILRHSEIKFIVLSPEFQRVVEVWRDMCGLTRTAGN